MRSFAWRGHVQLTCRSIHRSHGGSGSVAATVENGGTGLRSARVAQEKW